ncbi:MAG: YetF domain-containing protein [Nostoc sp.]
MSQQLWDDINWALGLGAEPKTLTFLQMALRAIIIYIAGLMMVRLAGDRRFSGRFTDFDVIMSITFGSLLSRAINGSAPFWGTIGVGFVLVGMNRLFALISDRSRSFRQAIAGNSLILIQDGEIQSNNLKKAHVSQSDLIASLRSNAHLSDPTQVKVARLERSGQISVIPRVCEPQVIEMTVEQGVQIVRVKLEP